MTTVKNTTTTTKSLTTKSRAIDIIFNWGRKIPINLPNKSLTWKVTYDLDKSYNSHNEKFHTRNCECDLVKSFNLPIQYPNISIAIKERHGFFLKHAFTSEI